MIPGLFSTNDVWMVMVSVSCSGVTAEEVTSNYVPDGDTNLDVVIFSRSDLVLNGELVNELPASQQGGRKSHK